MDKEIKIIFKLIKIEFKCDKCNKKILVEDSDIFACIEQLRENGWEYKVKEVETPFDPIVSYTLCPDCLTKARQLEKHFGIFDLYKDNEAQNG